MAREKKHNVQICVRISQGISEQLEKFCEDAGQQKGVAVERALTMYISDYYEMQKKILQMK